MGAEKLASSPCTSGAFFGARQGQLLSQRFALTGEREEEGQEAICGGKGGSFSPLASASRGKHGAAEKTLGEKFVVRLVMEAEGKQAVLRWGWGSSGLGAIGKPGPEVAQDPSNRGQVRQRPQALPWPEAVGSRRTFFFRKARQSPSSGLVQMSTARASTS